MTPGRTKPRTLRIEPSPGIPLAIGGALWRLEEARRRTHEAVADLPAASLDWQPPEGGNSIGSLLYHVALIEADWLYVEILEGSFPAEVRDRFPLDVRDEEGRLAHVVGVSLDEHCERLAFVRKRLLATVRGLSIDDYRRLRKLPSYHVSPEWVLLHLADHEAQHRGQILELRRRAPR